MSKKAAILTLLTFKGIGPRSVLDYFNNSKELSNLQQVIDAINSGRFKRLVEIPSETEIEAAFNCAVQTLEKCSESNIHVICFDDLPQRLNAIPNPPLILFLKGNIEALRRKSIAVIGTREPTDFGKESAFRISKSLAENGWMITSGLAKGCDYEAHAGCLAANGITTAVLAHGFGMIYPKEHAKFSEKILETGGALVSEYPPGCPPTKGSFIERDRLQSGISHGVIVVETDVIGGTMHTVKHARAQGRPVGAINHPESLRNFNQAKGNQKLVEEKSAIPLGDKASVIRFAENLETVEDSQMIKDMKQTNLF
jgi:DNA processing protein